MDNTVIKVVNKEHGRKVIEFFKSKGVNTYDSQGIITEADGGSCIYYGVIEGIFTNESEEDMTNNVKIIELPKEDIYPKEMLVSLDGGKLYSKRKVLGYFPKYGSTYLVESKLGNSIFTVRFAKDLPQAKEVTLKEVEAILGYSIKIVD